MMWDCGAHGLYTACHAQCVSAARMRMRQPSHGDVLRGGSSRRAAGLRQSRRRSARALSAGRYRAWMAPPCSCCHLLPAPAAHQAVRDSHTDRRHCRSYRDLSWLKPGRGMGAVQCRRMRQRHASRGEQGRAGQVQIEWSKKGQVHGTKVRVTNRRLAWPIMRCRLAAVLD